VHVKPVPDVSGRRPRDSLGIVVDYHDNRLYRQVRNCLH